MSEIRSSAQEVYDAFTDAINGLELFLEDEIEMQRGLVKSCDRTDRGWEANLHAQQILAYQNQKIPFRHRGLSRMKEKSD